MELAMGKPRWIYRYVDHFNRKDHSLKCWERRKGRSFRRMPPLNTTQSHARLTHLSTTYTVILHSHGCDRTSLEMGEEWALKDEQRKHRKKGVLEMTGASYECLFKTRIQKFRRVGQKYLPPMHLLFIMQC